MPRATPSPFALRALGATLIALAALCAGCAAIEPLDPGAAPGEEGAACFEADCAAGLECVAGTCIRPCLAPSDCGGRGCLPLPGGAGGWCAPAGVGEPAPDPAEPAPTEPAPTEPAPADPAPDTPPPAPGELPPKVPEDPAEPAPEPAPPTEPAPEPPSAPPPSAPPPEAPPPEAPPPCAYPAGPHALRDGAVAPNLSWRGAYDAAGRRVDFDFEAFHCDPAYDRYSIIAVVVGAEWCGACAQYLAQSAGRMRTAEAAGALYLFVETQDANYGPASHEVARRVIDRHAPGAPGLRVGDGATQPAGAIGNAPLVQQYPTLFAVRRRDMRVVPSLGGYLDFAALAAQEANRAPAPGGNGGGVAPDPAPDPGPGGCAEEPQEPNDTAGAAPTLRPGEQVVGGVCNGSDDYFRVEHDGFWTVDLRFRHAEGDLDLYLWDPLQNAPLIGLDGRPVGSASATDDELLVFLGPQVIQITGYQGARAGYVLTVVGH